MYTTLIQTNTLPHSATLMRKEKETIPKNYDRQEKHNWWLQLLGDKLVS